MKIAAEALKSNITSIAPIFLPWSEQLRFIVNLWARTLLAQQLSKSVPRLLSNCLYWMSSQLLWLPDRATDVSASRLKLKQMMRKLCSLPDWSESVDDIVPSAHSGSSNKSFSAANVYRSAHLENSTHELSATQNLRRQLGAPYVPDFQKAFTHFCVHAGGTSNSTR
jgi:hypothetical protein